MANNKKLFLLSAVGVFVFLNLIFADKAFAQMQESIFQNGSGGEWTDLNV